MRAKQSNENGQYENSIQRWKQQGKEKGATHLIIVSDGFFGGPDDSELYPKYVMPGQTLKKVQEGVYDPIRDVITLDEEVRSQEEAQENFKRQGDRLLNRDG